MIVTTTRHGRTRRDTRKLVSHLNKGLGQSARVAAIGGVALSNADDAVRYMEMMRDGSRASVAMHHVTLSPAADLSDAQRDQMVAAVLAEMGASEHAYVLWEHEKPRAESGGSPRHWHLVVSHVGPDGRALDDGQSYARLEAVARVLEADWGHALTPSRHAGAVAKRLDEVRPDVAAAVRAAQSEPPRSATSSSRRAVAARKGVDLPKAQAAVRAAWASADGPAAFRSAIAEQGFELAPGTKPGVFVVSAGTIEVGALDRIVREKRAVVRARMEEVHAPAEPAPAPEPAAVVADADASLRPDDEGRPRRSGNEGRRAASVPAPGTSRGTDIRRAEPDRGSEGPAGSGAPESTAPDGGGRGPAQSRRRDRVRDRAQVRALRGAATPRLRSLAADLREVSRPAIDRVRDALERRRSAAAAVFDRPLPVVPPSPALIAAAKAVKDAKRASTELYYGNARAVQAAEARRDAPEPRGLLARVLGRHAAWRQDRDDAAEFVRRFERAHSDALDRLDRATRAENRLAVPHHAVQRDAERRHEDDKRRAVQELRDVAAARDLLAREPALARFGEDRVLAEVRRERDVASHRPAPLPEPIRASGLRM